MNTTVQHWNVSSLTFGSIYSAYAITGTRTVFGNLRWNHRKVSDFYNPVNTRGTPNVVPPSWRDQFLSNPYVLVRTNFNMLVTYDSWEQCGTGRGREGGITSRGQTGHTITDEYHKITVHGKQKGHDTQTYLRDTKSHWSIFNFITYVAPSYYH